MPTLFIVRGLPSAGKASLSKKIEGVTAIAADDYPLYKDGEYQHHLQSVSHAWCRDEVEKVMRDRADVAVHNTFVTPELMDLYFELAKAHSYSVHIVHSEAVFDIFGEKQKSIHNVPDTVYESIKNRWEPLGGAVPTASNVSLKLTEEFKACCDRLKSLDLPLYIASNQQLKCCPRHSI